jgi:flotillin
MIQHQTFSQLYKIQQDKKGSISMGLFFLLMLSLVLIGAPIALNIAKVNLSMLSSLLMTGSGILLLLVCVILITITKLYKRTKASEAFVRTGMGGLKVIRDGGSLVLPVVHQTVMVSLETIKLEVNRVGADALITSDKLRADIKAEFFVRIQPTDEDIESAARSLGDKVSEINTNRGVNYKDGVISLLEDKLVSALRTSAACKTLEQLNSERNEFLKEVTQLVTDDLKHNGFLLETVTISKLDQTDVAMLKDSNIFDAQGARTIAEITQRNLTEKNKIIREGDQARKDQDVKTRTAVLELERKQAEAEATQAAQIAMIKAEQDRVTQEKQLEAQRAINVAAADNTRQTEVAKIVQTQAIQVSQREQQEAIVEADKKVEIAKRNQLKAIADSDAEKAQAEAKLADAEADRAKARQNITTVELVAAADREKQKAIIEAQAIAERNYVTTQKAADGDAYRIKVEADAKKASADAEAEATTKKATAEAIANQRKAEGNKALLVAEADGLKAKALAEAEGQKALAMVPVEVNARQVEVDKQRVEEVLVPELKARSENGEAAQNFELSKIRIEQEARVRIEAAHATAQFFGKIQANVYGTPEDVAKMSQHFNAGMGLSQAFGGFMAGADASTIETVKKVVGAVDGLATAATNKLSGKGSTSDAK